MARKLDSLKLVQEMRGRSAVTNRQPGLELTAFHYLCSPKLKISPPKKRLPVLVDAETRAAIPHSIKIIHAG